MPNVIAPVSNLEASVERPVVLDVVRQLMDITQISSKTPIAFYGDEAKAAQRGAVMGDAGLPMNRWNYDDKVTIEVEEEFDRERLLASAVKEEEQPFIWRDHSLRTAIKPVYGTTTVTVNFRFRARDKNAAKRWYNEMKTRCSMMRTVNLHTVQYHYQFPKEYLAILKEIHRLRERVAGYGDSFEKYLAAHMTPKAQLVDNMAGSDPLLVIAETQGRIQGFFRFEGIPEKPQKEGDHDTYTANFEYLFEYEKPVHCNMQYSLSVHQQLLAQKWRPKEKAYKPIDVLKTYSLSSLAFSKFETERVELETRANNGITIPSFDEHIPTSIVPSTLRVMTVLTAITPDNRRNLLNLGDLGGEFVLEESILDFIRQSEWEHMLKPYHSILHLSLYNYEKLYGDLPLTIDQSLEINATRDLDLRGAYRVRLSMVGDLRLLTPAAKKRLRDHPKAAEKILTAINAALTDKGGQEDLMKSRLTERELCELGFGYVKDSIDTERSALAGTVIRREVSRIAYGACDCRTGDSLPLRQSNCYDPYAKRLNLVQSLFVATRPMSMMQSDQNNNVYGATQRPVS